MTNPEILSKCTLKIENFYNTIFVEEAQFLLLFSLSTKLTKIHKVHTENKISDIGIKVWDAHNHDFLSPNNTHTDKVLL